MLLLCQGAQKTEYALILRANGPVGAEVERQTQLSHKLLLFQLWLQTPISVFRL